MTEAPRELTERICAGQRFGVLATCSDNKPHTHLMAFSVAYDLATILFASPRDTRKVADLKNNPRAAFMLDNRENLESDLSDAATVMAEGACEVVACEGDTCKPLAERYPAMKTFLNKPDTVLLLMTVEKWTCVDNFQEVRTWVPQ